MILMIIRYDMNKLTQFIPLLFEFDKHLFVFISFSRNLLALTLSWYRKITAATAFIWYRCAFAHKTYIEIVTVQKHIRFSKMIPRRQVDLQLEVNEIGN